MFFFLFPTGWGNLLWAHSDLCRASLRPPVRDQRLQPRAPHRPIPGGLFAVKTRKILPGERKYLSSTYPPAVSVTLCPESCWKCRKKEKNSTHVGGDSVDLRQDNLDFVNFWGTHGSTTWEVIATWFGLFMVLGLGCCFFFFFKRKDEISHCHVSRKLEIISVCPKMNL